jgi:hypothetical protein
MSFSGYFNQGWPQGPSGPWMPNAKYRHPAYKSLRPAGVDPLRLPG